MNIHILIEAIFIFGRIMKEEKQIQGTRETGVFVNKDTVMCTQ